MKRKICPSCNAQNTDESTVCYYCNTLLPPAELPLTQPAQTYGAQPYAAQPYAAQPYETPQSYGAQPYAPAQPYGAPQGGFTPVCTGSKPKNPAKVIIPAAVAVVLLFVVLVATHVICIFHDYSWKVKSPATLISAGKEVRSCSHCGKVSSSRTLEQKDPQPDGMAFNFTDEEFIEWVNADLAYTIDPEPTAETDEGTTFYDVISGTSGDVELMILHDDNGNIQNIVACCEESSPAAAFAIVIASSITSDFDVEDAIYDLVYDDEYTSGGIHLVALTMDDGTEATCIVTEEYWDSL